MHKRLAKFLNFKNEGKEINVENVLDMLNCENEAVRNLILNHETNEYLHQNAPEDAIKIAICNFIVEAWEDEDDIIGRWYGYPKTLICALNKFFNDNYDWDYIQRAYDFLDKKMPESEEEREERNREERREAYEERMEMY